MLPLSKYYFKLIVVYTMHALPLYYNICADETFVQDPAWQNGHPLITFLRSTAKNGPRT